MLKYPDDSIQNLSTNWWEADKSPVVCRGSLIWTYVQFFSQIPLELTAERIDPEHHEKAEFKARPLNASGKRTVAPSLPVAGLPRLLDADCHITNRAKKRPCLVIGAVNHRAIEKTLTVGMTNTATLEYFLVAPYFSVGQDGKGGYNPAFVERVRHVQYSRFFWDILPISSGKESMLRFDQIQPVGLHHQAFEKTDFRLCNEALGYVDEWLSWLIYEVDGEKIKAFRELVQSLE